MRRCSRAGQTFKADSSINQALGCASAAESANTGWLHGSTVISPQHSRNTTDPIL
jgi:hypothetical protein